MTPILGWSSEDAVRASPQKPLLLALAGVEVGRKEFQRNGTLQLLVERAVDNTHATAAGGAKYLVVTGNQIPYNRRALTIGHGSVSITSSQTELGAFSRYYVVGECWRNWKECR